MTIVFVTGSNQGLGYALLERLGKETKGTKLIMGSRNEDRGRAAVKKLADSGIKDVDLVVIDVTDNESVLKAAKTIEARYGHLDVLVNNAAIITDPEVALERETFNRLYDVNVSSVITVCKVFQPLLMKSSAAVCINVSSGLGSHTVITTKPVFYDYNYVSYACSKSALNQLSLYLSHEWKDKIKVAMVCPGYCSTQMSKYMGDKKPYDGVKVMMECITNQEAWTSGQFLNFEPEHTALNVIPW